VRIDKKAKKAWRRRFARGWMSLISLSLFLAGTLNTKEGGRLSITSLLSIIFEKRESAIAIF
jgi:hypothetical protein